MAYGKPSQSLLNTMSKLLWQVLAFGMGSNLVCLALLYLNLIRIQILYLILNGRDAPPLDVAGAEPLAADHGIDSGV
jgi:hypothetical protein